MSPSLRRAALLALVCVFAAALRAESLDRNYNPRADDIVYALAAEARGGTIVGGALQTVGGQAFRWLGRLNADGSRDASFAPVLNGVVQAIVVLPSGKILVAGQFTTAGGLTRNGIARLHADGTVDATFNPGAGARGSATSKISLVVVQADGRILVGGDFETFDGQSRLAVARLNADGSLDATFGDPGIRDYPSPSHARGAFALALQADGKVLVGGQFLTVGGQPRLGLARLNSDGSVDTSFNPSTTPVNHNAIVVQPDGRILVAGPFSTLGGFASPELARLNPDGTTDRTFAPNPNDRVTSIFLQPDGRIVLSGFFTTIGGQPRLGFARLTASGAVDPSFNLDVTYSGLVLGPVNALQLQPNGTTLVGGRFATIAGASISNLARLAAPVPSRLVNLSTRGFIAAGDALSVGLVARGTKSILLRAIGPGLTAFGVAGALADPRIDEFRPGASAPETFNDDWSADLVTTTTFASVGAFPLTPSSKDSVSTTTLTNGSTTARITSAAAGGSGVVLAEAYDRNATDAGRLINLSTMGFAGAGAQSLAAGFVIGGETMKTVLIRAIGPGLTQFGVTGVVADPQLAVVPLGSNMSVASNDNWAGDASLAAAFAASGAFSLPNDSRDAALVVRLAPGAYTASVTGAGNATGRALVEIYDLDP